MFGVNRRPRTAGAAAAVLAAAAAGLAPPPAAADGGEPPWRRLEFQARKLFLSAAVAVEFDSAVALPADDRCEARASWPAASARIRIESAVLGRRSQSSLWLAPETLRAYARVLEDRGRRNRYKSYAFCRSSVVADRATPNRGEVEMPVAEWTHRYTLVHEVPAGLPAPLSEPAALPYLVGRLASEPNAPASRVVPVFSNNQVLTVRIDREAQSTRAAPEFTAAGGPLPAELTLFRFALTPASLEEGGSVEDFELLGLEGEIEILAARELQLPVSISGRLPPVGRVSVRLRHVELRGDE